MQLDPKRLANLPNYKYFHHFFTNTAKKTKRVFSIYGFVKKKINLASDRHFSKDRKYVTISELIHYTFNLLIKTNAMQ